MIRTAADGENSHVEKTSPINDLNSSTASSARMSNAKAAVEFARLCGNLKTTKRTGWVKRNVHNPESVADHSWRVSVLCLLFLGQNNENDDGNTFDFSKCLEMAVIHDLAESIVGDIAPSDNVPSEIKQQMEHDAINHIAKILGKAAFTSSNDKEETKENHAQQHLLSIFEEYEQRQSKESVLVKDLDLLDMILQAEEYEQHYQQQQQQQQQLDGFSNNNDASIDLDLSEFFKSTPPSRFKNEFIQSVALEVHQQRKERKMNYKDISKKENDVRLNVVNDSKDTNALLQMNNDTTSMNEDQQQRYDDDKQNPTAILTSMDVEFSKKYATTSKFTIEEVQSVVQALRDYEKQQQHKI